MPDEVKTPDTPLLSAERPKRRWLRPTCIALIILTSVSIGAGALCWRLAQGPWHADFAIPLIESALSDKGGLQFDIGDLNMVWRGGNTPLGFELSDIKVTGAKGAFLTISKADLGLSPLYLFIGRVHFAHADISNLDLRIIRLPDGKITLTGTSETKDATQRADTVALTLSEIARKLPAIDRLTLKDTLVIFEDQRDVIVRRFEDVQVEMTQSGTLGARSFAGYITAPLTGLENDSNAAMDFVYNASDEILAVAASLENASTRRLLGSWLRQANLPMIDMQVKGRAQVELDNDFLLHALNFHLQGTDGTLRWPRNYGEGLETQKLTNFDVEISFDPTTQALELKNAEITFKGLTIAASGALEVSDSWQNLDGYLNVNIPVLAVDLLPAIWPTVWDSGARHWLVDRMDKGRFSKIAVNVPLKATLTQVPADEVVDATDPESPEENSSQRWAFETGTVKSTFEFTGVTIDYREPMIPVKNTTGTGRFEGLSLFLDIDRATIGGLNASAGTLEFDDLITAGKGDAIIHLDLAGPIQSVFDYLDKEPISYRKKIDLDLSKSSGNANLDVDVKFPLTKDMRMEDVHVLAKAKLQNLNIPGAVKGMTLAGGPFDLEASENHFRISGTGTLEGQPATVMWHELFAPTAKDPFASKLEADLQTNKPMRRTFIGTLEDRVDDAIIPATVSMTTTPNGKAAIKVNATLDAARVDFTNPFNAIKEKGIASKVVLTGTLQDGFLQSIDTLSASGPGLGIASGNIAFNRDKDNDPVLSKAVLKGLVIGQTNADINAAWPTENEIKADIVGKSFDARWIMADAPPAPATPAADAASEPASIPGLGYDVALKLDRLLVAETPLEKVSAAFIGHTKGVQTMASLDATAGGGAVTLRYDADRLSFDIQNAGAGLEALGITERVRGGTMRVSGTPIKDGRPGDMEGKLLIENFSVRKAPMLAKLINILSIPGLLGILNQDTGLKFQRAEANILWLNNPGGATLRLKDGRTSGASLGLTFEGDVDTAKNTLAIQGTVVPMSEVNGLLASIPLVGDILTGGKSGSGIFAATYTMKGPGSDPDVSVNPLSVLTPGILRRILFEGALTETKPKTEAGTAPKTRTPLTK